MPRFFFDTDNGDQVVPDVEGMDLPSLDAARQQAQDALGDLARDNLPDDLRRVFSVVIRDESHRRLMRVALELTTERL